jgi:tetratricopeptide (TPR) repeat protein
MRHIYLVGLLAVLIVTGCSRKKVAREVAASPPAEEAVALPRPRPVDEGKPNEVKAPRPPVVVTPAERTPDVRGYEAALLEAVDFLAQRKYAAALAALEKAQKCQDTGAIQREIDRVRAVLAEQAAADKSVKDVKIVLEDGKPDDAARLAAEALAQHGGGDRADELARLKQQADAIATASDEAAARLAKLKADANTALDDRNLRAAAVALEQALSQVEDADLLARLRDVRDKLQIYDDNRLIAAELRSEPTRLEEGLACLRKALAAWDTLQVRAEIDDYLLIIDKRRDRLAVANFEVLGDVGVPAAGRTVAEELLGRFKPRFDVVERGGFNRILEDLNLSPSDLVQAAAGGEAARLAKVRYVVVGSVTPLAGVTVQARLIELSTGLVVQTARLSAVNMDALVPLLGQLAQVLQMADDEKLAFEAKLAADAALIKPVDAAPVQVIPPPPPVAAGLVVAPIVTWSLRPPLLGGLIIQDFVALPPVVVGTPAAPPALELVIRREDPRRNRLLRLALELGDNLFRRGRPAEAQRFFSLAFTLAGPRPEISLRLNACRDAAPPPVLMTVAPIRPRLAVLGFLLAAAPGVAPANLGELAADQFASYCSDYELIDRGEVSWYMGRLGITMRDLLRDPVARRCLAQALNVRFFVFGSIQQTASFVVSSHLIDAESGARTGTGTIHVQDHVELKLRMHELIRQLGTKPVEQKKLQEQSKATEKTLIEARRLLRAKEPNRAAELLRTLPPSIGQRSLLADAVTLQKLAAFEEARQRGSADRTAAMRAAQKRREDLAEKLAQARLQAQEQAKARTEAERMAYKAQRELAAARLQQQALAASTSGDHQRAMHLLQGSVALKADDSAFRQLAVSTLAEDRAARERIDEERRKRDGARQAQIESARKRVERHLLARTNTDSERRKALEAHDLALHDGFARQARELMKKDPEAALAAAQSARRVKSSMQSATLVWQAQDALALADAEKRGAEAKRKLEEERKKREEAALAAKRNREAYVEALKKGDDAATAKKLTEAVGHYQQALKLFRTDLVLSKLKSASDVLAREREASAAKEAETKRKAQVRDLVSQGNKALAAKKYTQAVDLFKQARKLAPDNVDALTGLSRAERERDMEAGRLREREMAKQRDIAYAGWMKLGDKALAGKKHADALKSYEEALKIKPGDDAGLKGKRAALEAFKKAIAVDPRMKRLREDYQLAMDAAKAAVKKNNWTGAINSFNEALRLMPGDKAAADGLASAQKLAQMEESSKRDAAYSTWLKQGDAALAARRYADAAKAYDEALKVKPGDAIAIKGKRAALDAQAKSAPPPVNPKTEYDKFIQQGSTMEKQGKYSGAMTAYQQALKWAARPPAGNADAFKAYMGIGRLEHAAKRYPEAVKAYEEALKRMPNQPEAKDRLQRAKARKP